jgi:hypothetical protein
VLDVSKLPHSMRTQLSDEQRDWLREMGDQALANFRHLTESPARLLQPAVVLRASVVVAMRHAAEVLEAIRADLGNED